MKAAILDKVLERLGQLSAGEVQGYLERLVREQGALASIFNAIREGILVLDEGGRIQYHNPAAAALLGFQDEGAVGQAIERHVRGLDWKGLVRQGASASRDLEIRYPEHRFLTAYAIPLNLGRADALGAALVLHDATASLKAMDAMAANERIEAVTTMAASVAHEIGNPLNTFDIHLQLMERELRKLPEAQAARLRQAVRVSREEVRRIDGIVRHFLKTVRPAPPHFRLASLNRVVREAVEFLRPEIESRDLLVETELAEGLPRLMIDPDQVHQVLVNLVKNAIQAMRTGGILRVRTEFEEDAVVAAIRDTGEGFDPETLARRGDGFVSTKPGGSGLGLVIVNRIVGAHGGQMEIKSQRGSGTEVRVRLPLPAKRVKMLPGGTTRR